MSIFSSLGIGISGLEAYLRALQVTSHNIANANTPGYSRQRVVLSQNNSIDLGRVRLPTGVSISQIQRIVDPALFLNIQKRINEMGTALVEKNAFSRIEGFSLEIQGKGLIENLKNFSHAISDFASNTNDNSFKSLVITTGQKLLDSLSSYTNNLDNLFEDFQNTIPDKINLLNTKLQQLGEINEEIVQIEKAGAQSQIANDLRDKREQIIKEISQLINISSFEDQYGNINISINGEMLVKGKEVNKLQLSQEIVDGKIVKQIKSSKTGTIITPSGGELGGIFQLKNKIDDIKSELEGIFRGLIYEFNKLQSTGAGKEIYSTITSNITFPESSKIDVLQKEIKVDSQSKFQIQSVSLTGLPDKSFKDYYILKQTATGGNIIARVSDFFGTTGTIITDREINVKPGDKLFLSATPFTLSNGSFDIVTVDLTNNTQKTINIPVDLDNINPDVNLTTLVTNMNSIFISQSVPLIATITSDNKLKIESTNSTTRFYFKNDSSNILSAGQLNSFFTGATLSDFGINPALKNNLNLISYAQDFLTQDNNVALQFSQLSNQPIFDSGESVENRLVNFFSNLSNDINNANTNLELQNDLLAQLEMEREKISGVNLDEEAANLILYQKAFTANAKFIQTIDKVLDTLLSVI